MYTKYTCIMPRRDGTKLDTVSARFPSEIEEH